ncbi:MAG: phage holin family protein [Patescibacteria group bacterium]
MIKFIARILAAVAINVVGLILVSQFVAGFSITQNFREIAIIALALTLLNFFLKPLLKLILGPFIILSLGLGLIVVNALILKLLDFFFVALTIQTVLALFEATIVFGVINLVFHIATRNSR